MQKIIAFFMSIIAVIYGLFGIPYYAAGERLDLDRFELVWSDEFNGDSVDESMWHGHYVWHDYEIRRGGYWDKKMATVNGGNLTIRSEYLPDGLERGCFYKPTKYGWEKLRFPDKPGS